MTTVVHTKLILYGLGSIKNGKTADIVKSVK
jgi:hypothetical protein